MYCPYLLLAAGHSRGRTKGIAKEISEIIFKMKT
jgi:hypothetical protein